ncbi:MAG: NB-ARC domain-containing protein [Leptolyngbyaceae cyanobacterium]
MALSDQPFIPSTVDNLSENKLHTYCTPLDTLAKGVLDNRKIEQIQQNLHEYRVRSNLQDQLPPDILSFAGRLNELQAIAEHLIPADQAHQTLAPAVFVVNGKAGVGKSVLAVRAAYQLRPFYPDAQLYVNLHGSGSQTLSLDTAIAYLLRTWNEQDGWLPKTLGEKVTLYHEILADKRVLIVLDDAGDLAQIKPLIPKAAHCAVLITSRHSVQGLAPTKQLTLDAMSEEDSLQLLLQASAGEDIAPVNSEVAKQIVHLCDRNPLALQIAAHTLPDTSSQQLVDYESRLATERHKLASFNSNDLAVRASFALAYEELDENCQQLFKRLSLSAQPVLTNSMAQMLLASDLDSATVAIATLLKRQLLRQIAQHRYEFQPLLRLIAKEKLAQTESSKLRQAMRTKITRWYLQRAETMSLLFHPTTRSQLLSQLGEDSQTQLWAEELTLRLSALEWFETESSNLMACITWAHQAKAWKIVTQFAKHLIIFWVHGSYWQAWESSHQIGIEGARKLGNRKLEAQIATNLGNCFLRQAYWEKAKTQYENSLSLFKEIGDSEGEAQTAKNLSLLHRLWQAGATGDQADAKATQSAGASTADLAGNAVAGLQSEAATMSTAELLEPPTLRPASLSEKNTSGHRNTVSTSVKLNTGKRASKLTTWKVYVVVACVAVAIAVVAITLILT